MPPRKTPTKKKAPARKKPLISKTKRAPVGPTKVAKNKVTASKKVPARKRAPTKKKVAARKAPPPADKTPDEAEAFMFLEAYLRFLNPNHAARAILNEEDRKNSGKVRRTAKRLWNSKVFQEMLDEHLEEFGKKTKRLRRTVVSSLIKEMGTDQGVGSHQARVRAAEVLAKTLGMDQPKKKEAASAGTGVLVVPGAISLEDWTTAAANAQEELRKKTREASK